MTINLAKPYKGTVKVTVRGGILAVNGGIEQRRLFGCGPLVKRIASQSDRDPASADWSELLVVYDDARFEPRERLHLMCKRLY